MKRRGFLKLGVGAAIVVGVAGAGVALIKPGWVDHQLSPGARELMRASALAVLGELLPAAGPARDAALQAQLGRVTASIAALPAAVRKDLSDALGLLSTAVGRHALVGLSTPWAQAGVPELQQAFNGMRLSTSHTRQQVYHALRDLNVIAFFTDPANQALSGYPGPREIP